MAINTSGQWWVGDQPTDLAEYLKAFKTEGYEVDRFKLAHCSCGCEVFRLQADSNEGAAKGTCTSCGDVAFMGESDKYFASTTEAFKCIECRGDACNVGVGFSMYESESHYVRCLSVGVRCAQCGILGCIIDWKVGGGNEPGFLEKV